MSLSEKSNLSVMNVLTNQPNRRYVTLFLLFLASIFFVFILNMPGPNNIIHYKHIQKSIQRAKNCSQSNQFWSTWTSFIRFCLSDRLRSSKQSAWRVFHQHVGACLGEAGWRMMDPKVLRNRDDVKFAILPHKNFGGNSNCTVVTLGIGNDVDAELKLRQFLPNCQFFGADPSEEQGRIYDQVLGGRYFRTAISDRDGLTTANILERDGYHTRGQIPTKNFLDFLIKDVRSPKIDYLFMDNEGAEYGILRQFFNSHILDQENLVVCQLSVELHGPLEQYGMNETSFQRLMEDILSKSPMLPIWSAEPVNHMRSFYINVQNPYCLEKYLWGYNSDCHDD